MLENWVNMDRSIVSGLSSIRLSSQIDIKSITDETIQQHNAQSVIIVNKQL